MIRRSLLVGLLLSLSCGGSADVPVTSTSDAGTLPDAGIDAGTPDAGESDAGIPDAGQPDAGATDAGTDAGTVAAVRIRLMAGNLSSGNNQDYTAGEGLRIIEGLHPDVAMLQEFNYQTNSQTDLRAFTDAACGTTCAFFRESIAGNGNIPNGIVSRYPIVQAGRFVDSAVANRGFVWAEIAIPGPKHLWVISVHLLTDTSKHTTEGTELVDDFGTSLVPAGDYLALGGDFNSDTRTDAAVTKLADLFVTASPYPTDGSNQNTNASRAKPYDWVLANSALDSLETPVVIGANNFNNGLVVDTRVYTPISDLSPALATDSAATNMQHMAVVRDFLIPPP